ncbi:hypothetical protein ACKWTF_005665 [Chironomus riparius]
MKKSNKQGSMLRIKQFSESESDGEQDNNEVIEDQAENSIENEEMDQTSDVEEHPEEPTTSTTDKKQKKTRKKGIIYIGNIPQHMNVAICREFMEPFGEVGRIFLQPDKKGMTKKANNKKKNVTFTEGWVEFEKKRVAKWVAQHINNTPITTKKGSKFSDILWSIKYLAGFKWIHLSERLTFERAVQHQRKQMAISKARKEASFFQNNLDKSERSGKIRKKNSKTSK